MSTPSVPAEVEVKRMARNGEQCRTKLAGREHERAMVNTDGEDCLDAVLKVLCGEDSCYSE